MPIQKQMNKTLTRHVYSHTHMGLSIFLRDYVLMIFQQSQYIKVSLAGCDDTYSPSKLNDYAFEANLSSQQIPIINNKHQQLNVTRIIYWGKQKKNDKVEQIDEQKTHHACILCLPCQSWQAHTLASASASESSLPGRL